MRFGERTENRRFMVRVCTYGRTEIDSARTVYNNSVFTYRTRIAKRKKIIKSSLFALSAMKTTVVVII